jgi:hypothetical protein
VKASLYSAIAALCLALAVPTAFAARISGDVTATVFQIYDPANLLGGQVSMDQAGRGRFSYETDVPMTDRWSTWDGTLEVRSFAESASQGSLAFTLGGLVFETDASSPNWMYQVEVWDAGYNTGNPDQIRLYGWPFKPVPGLPGVDGVQVTFQFAEYYNTYTVMEYPMPTSFPDLDRFRHSWVTISGWNASTGAYFEVRLQMQTVQPSVAAEPTVSPAPGAFVRQQPIVPAVMLPSGTPVLAIEGNINGFESPAYFAGCSQTATVLRLAFVCPDLNPNLAPGMNRVEWRVRLNDGSVTSKVVEWEIVQ